MHDRMMTYAELAEFLGKSEEAARQFAKRRRWRRSISNDDGKARVSVPVEFLEMPRPPVDPRPEEEPDAERTEADHPDTLEVLRMLRSRIAELEGDITDLEKELSSVRSAFDVERIRAAQVEVLQALLAAERTRVEDIKASEARRIEDLQAERDRWMAQAERLIPLATPAPKPTGWWPWRRTA